MICHIAHASSVEDQFSYAFISFIYTKCHLEKKPPYQPDPRRTIINQIQEEITYTNKNRTTNLVNVPLQNLYTANSLTYKRHLFIQHIIRKYKLPN